jgi:hypothetical protein
VETLYLVHLTERFLDDMYAGTFKGVETVHFEGLEVQRYKSISSRMIQFEITTLFQARNEASVPSIAEVKNVVEEGMKHGGAFYAEYLASLEQMPFAVFSTTVSCHVVTDADELDNLINFQSGRVDDDKPPIILICAVLMACLSVCVCAVAWFRCVRKAKITSAAKYATPCNSEGIANFKTAVFDDLIPDDGCFVDEADVESVETSNLVEVELTDDYESVEESEWTDESSIRSQGSNADFTEESQESDISTLQKKFCQAASCGMEREQPLEESSQSSKSPKTSVEASDFPLPVKVTNLVEQQLATPCIEKCLQEASEKNGQLRSTIVLRQAQQLGGEEDTVCRQRFTTKQAARDEMTTADQNRKWMKVNPTTDSKYVPLWMIKRQEIMKRREQQSEQQQQRFNKSDRPGVETNGLLPTPKEAANDTSKTCGALHSQESIVDAPKSVLKDQCRSQNPIRADEPAPVSSTPLSVLDTSMVKETTDQSSNFDGESSSEALKRTASKHLSDFKPAGPSSVDQCSLRLDELPSIMTKQTKAAVHQNAMKIETAPSMLLWMSKRQEILQPNEQLSENQALNVEKQHPAAINSSFQLPLIEEVTDPVSRTCSELNSGEPSVERDEYTNASVDEYLNAIRTKSTVTDDEIPLWLKRRPDVVQSEEESVHEGDDFDDASDTSLNGAPAWMTRFKQLEKE